MSHANDAVRRRHLGTAFPSSLVWWSALPKTCQYCRAEKADQVDHVFPVQWAGLYSSLSGKPWESFNTVENASHSCGRCHFEKTRDEASISDHEPDKIAKHYHKWMRLRNSRKVNHNLTEKEVAKLAKLNFEHDTETRRFNNGKRDKFSTRAEFDEWKLIIVRKIAAMRRMK